MKTTEDYSTPKTFPLQILIPTRSSLLCINESEISYIEADDNYSIIHLLDGKTFTICKTLKDFEKMVTKNLFFRCHHSCLVNISVIREVLIKKNCLYLLNGDVVQLAKRRKKALKDFINHKTSHTTYLEKMPTY